MILAGVDPADTVYVGDTFSRDILGAFKAGYRGPIMIQSCLSDKFDPDRFPPESTRNLIEITSLSEIPGILGEFAKEPGV